MATNNTFGFDSSPPFLHDIEIISEVKRKKYLKLFNIKFRYLKVIVNKYNEDSNESKFYRV